MQDIRPFPRPTCSLPSSCFSDQELSAAYAPVLLSYPWGFHRIIFWVESHADWSRASSDMTGLLRKGRGAVTSSWTALTQWGDCWIWTEGCCCFIQKPRARAGTPSPWPAPPDKEARSFPPRRAPTALLGQVSEVSSAGSEEAACSRRAGYYEYCLCSELRESVLAVPPLFQRRAGQETVTSIMTSMRSSALVQQHLTFLLTECFPFHVFSLLSVQSGSNG